VKRDRDEGKKNAVLWARDEIRVFLGERTLRTLPVILTGCDAPTKSLRCAKLTRVDTWSLDIAMVGSDSARGKVASITR
jgi:hypothetical protein